MKNFEIKKQLSTAKAQIRKYCDFHGFAVIGETKDTLIVKTPSIKNTEGLKVLVNDLDGVIEINGRTPFVEERRYLIKL